MLQIYFFVTWFYHVNYCIFIEVFKNTFLAKLIQNAKKKNLGLKCAHLFITSDLFTAIISNFILWDNINMTATFKLIFVGFFHMEKFIHTKQQTVDS